MSIVAAMLYAIEPLSILYASQLLTETLFAALVMVWLYFLLKYLERQSLWDLRASGVASAFSVYVRPVGYFLPLLLATGLTAWVVAYHRRNKGHLLIQIALFMILSMGLTGVWQLRNRAETGYSGFSGIASTNMYFYLAASVLAVQQHMPLDEVQRRLGLLDDLIYFERHPEQKAWPLAQRLDYMSAEARRVLQNNLLIYTPIYLAGLGRVVFGPGAAEFLKFLGLNPNDALWGNVILSPLALLYPLLGGMVLFSRRLMRDPGIIAAVLTIAYYLILAGGPVGYSRYRHPVMPIVCVLSGYGLCTLRSWGRRAGHFYQD